MYAEVNGSTLVTWPYDYDTLCKKNPFTNFPANTSILDLYQGTAANLAGNTLVFVVQEAQPSVDQQTQIAVLNANPTFNGSGWVLGWTIQTMTTEQQNSATAAKAAAVRTDRDKKLADSDWTQLADVVLSNKTNWVSYRQSLRDLPSQSGFPWNVIWPVSP